MKQGHPLCHLWNRLMQWKAIHIGFRVHCMCCDRKFLYHPGYSFTDESGLHGICNNCIHGYIAAKDQEWFERKTNEQSF
jgi:hypothetical protein